MFIFCGEVNLLISELLAWLKLFSLCMNNYFSKHLIDFQIFTKMLENNGRFSTGSTTRGYHGIETIFES